MELSESTFAGLTTEAARSRFLEIGPNEPSPIQRKSALAHLFRQFTNPLIVVLLAASVLSAGVGDWTNAVIIFVMVLLGAAVAFVQSHRSQRAVDDLRQSVAPTATVLRDGKWVELPRREIVPDDVIRLSAGDLVPADGTLIHAEHLHLQESALTGESLPVEKQAEIKSSQSLSAAAQVFLGTSVVTGTGTALVMATGPRTSFGAIAQQLAAHPPETEFDRGTHRFGLFIMRTVVFLVLFVFLTNAVLKRDPFESLLFAIALAVGLTPEFLPMITSVTLAQGAVHMARKKVIVKNLASMQNFGSIDVLCSDKTGTLTTGILTLDRHVDPFGTPSEKTFQLIYLNSLLQCGVSNPVDESLRSADIRNPLDAAILNHDRPDVRNQEKIAEIPFDYDRRLLSVVARNAGECLLVTKGAPESLIEHCSSYEVDGEHHPIDAEALAHLTDTYQNFTKDGLRVLAVAYRSVRMQAAYGTQDERDLILAGFVTFLDPPQEGVADAIAALRRDRIDIKVITGDSALVAKYICERVGLDVGRIVEGTELDHINDSALAQLAERTTVFARVSPMQKNRIILALKARKHVVGYLGDGINDAPSLHTADVGISVSSAVDVARDAAGIILLERSLRVLHEGIIEGRMAFGNVMKYLLMGTSSNFGNMFSMAAASIFLPFLPMLPTQILLNNFLYDLAQITIPTDNVDPSFIRKPRGWDIRLIRNFMIFIGPISSIYDFITFYVMLVVFKAGAEVFHTGWFVESLATQTLVLFVIRTADNPFRSRPSFWLAFTTVFVVLLGIALPYTSIAPLIGFVPLPGLYFTFLLGATMTYLLFVEAVKRRLLRES